jgi:hypothetical protein
MVTQGLVRRAVTLIRGRKRRVGMAGRRFTDPRLHGVLILRQQTNQF